MLSVMFTINKSHPGDIATMSKAKSDRGSAVELYLQREDLKVKNNRSGYTLYV
jgi:hypothetical protein